jgi:ABC-type Fe3+/spermidine/putrescine transport system ATPase subunit
VALHEVDLDIADGEFVTLLGPSGCGKTTLLRIVGGFDRPTSGRVLLMGKDVTRTPPHRRPVNLVFQRPTMFPHLSVWENVAFGPRLAGVGRADLGERVREALRLVRLEGYGERRAHQLSGGQLQRVALARAIVNQPQVLLLDEPLSALDLTVRLEMEEELRRLHRTLGVTFVYVTHDQREALALSDRVVVLNEGRIEQVGSSDEVYRRPATPFVARLVGDSNVVPARVETDDAEHVVCIGDRRIGVTADAPGAVWLVIRPDEVSVTAPGADHLLSGVVRDLAYRGTGYSYRVAVEGVDTLVKVEVAGTRGFAVGDPVGLSWPRGAALVLPRDDRS